MASIKKMTTQKGVSYKIIVSNGYDVYGKKIVKSTTYKPDMKLSLKQQEKAVEKFALEFEERVKCGESFEGEKMAFDMFANKWLDNMKGNLTYRTYSCYEMNTHNRIIPFFRGYSVSQIKTPMIEQFYKELSKKLKHASIKKCNVILSSMFSTAVRWGLVNTNPCDKAKLPKMEKTTNDLKFFTPEQSLHFLDSLERSYEITYKSHRRVDDTGIPYMVRDYVETRVVPTQYKVFFNIALLCGLRRNEILALCWDDIDFERRTITVNKSVTKTEYGVSIKEPKTASSVRKLVFPSEMIPLLKQYRREYNLKKLSLGSYWKGEGNLFIRDDGSLMGEGTPYQYFRKHIKKYNTWVISDDEAKEKGYEVLPIIPLHGLRHSCATLLNSMGVNIIDISNILGHAQTSTTMNIYAHSFEKQTREASDKIDNFLRNHA